MMHVDPTPRTLTRLTTSEDGGRAGTNRRPQMESS